MTYLPIPPSGPSVDNLQTDPFTATAAQKFFTLSRLPVDPTDTKMVANGSPQVYGTDIVVVGSSANFLETDFDLEAGDSVEFTYHF